MSTGNVMFLLLFFASYVIFLSYANVRVCAVLPTGFAMRRKRNSSRTDRVLRNGPLSRGGGLFQALDAVPDSGVIPARAGAVVTEQLM